MTVKKVAVICGASVVTSTLIADKLKQLFKENNIKAKIVTGMSKDAAELIPGSDLIVHTALLSNFYGVPAVNGMSFLTRVGLEKAISRILEILGKE